MSRRRDAVVAGGDAACARNLHGNLGGRQDPAMAGLRALAYLQLDHLDLVARGGFAKARGREGAVRVAGAEIAGPYLPDGVAAIFRMVGGKAAFSGVVGE